MERKFVTVGNLGKISTELWAILSASCWEIFSTRSASVQLVDFVNEYRQLPCSGCCGDGTAYSDVLDTS